MLKSIFRGFLLCGVIGLQACSDGSDNVIVSGPQPIPDPVVEGPVTGSGSIFVAGTQNLDLASVGYRQDEYFLSGTASAFVNTSELTEDGAWSIEPGEEAQYTTRIIVYRPIADADFSGVVIQEWLNVSGGLDSAPDWSILHVELLRQGHVWVGVSAQKVGVENDGAGFDLSLKTVDPVRYGPLSHPGDSFSYDLFSQVAQALRQPIGVDPLDGLAATTVIAVGESQSAGRILTYVNALAPYYGAFDGYLVHSRLRSSSALSQSPQADIRPPEVVRVREDLNVPVLMFQTDTDVVLLGSLGSRQPDSDQFRLWEVAGTAHGDVYSLLTSNSDIGDDPSIAVVVEESNPVPGFIQCDSPINSGPHHWVAKAGLRALVSWAQGGEGPPEGARLDVNDSGDDFLLDSLGNATGGIRTPYVDVPVAVLSGLGQDGESFCRLFGTTQLFDEAQLAALYGTPAAYVQQVSDATDAAVAAGFILPEDAVLIKEGAELQWQ